MSDFGVCVIIPCYNGEAFLADSIRSVLAQTVPVQELLVVDDGSQDRSAEVAEAFSSPVRVIRQPNSGVAAARNRGVSEAQGEWVAFLDADDLWQPDKLEKQLARAAEGYDFVYCDAVNFGDCEGMPRQRGDYVAFPEGDVFARLIEGNFVTTSSVLIRRELFTRIGRFRGELTLAEDWGLWLEAAGVVPFGVVREPLVRYRVHPGGISRNADNVVRAALAVLDWAKSLPRAREVPARAWRRGRASVYGVGGLAHERAGNRLGAIKHSLRAVGQEPLSHLRWKSLIRAALEIK